MENLLLNQSEAFAPKLFWYPCRSVRFSPPLRALGYQPAVLGIATHFSLYYKRKEMKRGKFIVFEGLGGSGKTTQIKKAQKHLIAKGYKVVVTREPGGVSASETIRELIFKLKGLGIANADHQTALFFAARYIWLKEVVKPAVKKGQIVLSDRFDSSTNAYQGWAEGGNRKTIKRFSEVVSDGFVPDAIIVLRVTPKTAMERKINKEGDPFDNEEDSYFQKLAKAYDHMVKNKWRGIDWYVVDGEKSVVEVAEAINAILDQITYKNG